MTREVSAHSEQLTQHHASAQVLAGEDGQTRAVWIAGLLPKEAARAIGQLIEQAMPVMKRILDGLAEKNEKNRAALHSALVTKSFVAKAADAKRSSSNRSICVRLQNQPSEASLCVRKVSCARP
jgi:hypothetical protein